MLEIDHLELQDKIQEHPIDEEREATGAQRSEHQETRMSPHPSVGCWFSP